MGGKRTAHRRDPAWETTGGKRPIEPMTLIGTRQQGQPANGQRTEQVRLGGRSPPPDPTGPAWHRPGASHPFNRPTVRVATAAKLRTRRAVSKDNLAVAISSVLSVGRWCWRSATDIAPAVS